jgi:hypothetical protein
MEPNTIGFGCSLCSFCGGFCVSVVCASWVICLFARGRAARLGFLLGRGTIRGSAAIIDDDDRAWVGAESGCVDDADLVMNPFVGRILATLKASTSAVAIRGWESNCPEV